MNTRLLSPILILLFVCAERPAYAKGTGYVFVSSEKDHVVTVFRSGSMDEVKKIPTGQRPRSLRFSPDYTKLYVACGDDDSIDVIDVEKLEVVKSIPVGDDPDRFDISPDGRFIYASNEDEGLLTIYDIVNDKLVAEIPVGEEPEGVLASPDNKRIYVASEVANMVHVIDAQSHELTANIVVGTRPRRFALTPNDQELWVTNEVGGTVTIIDTQSNRVIGEVRFEPKGFRPEEVTPVGIVITRDGQRAYVTLGHANHVATVDVASRQVQDYVLVGRRAWGAALSDDENTLYVVNGKSDDLSVIDTRRKKVIRSVPAGRVPHDVVVDN